jgi:hypothetical protein
VILQQNKIINIKTISKMENSNQKPQATVAEFEKREKLESKIDLLSLDSKEFQLLNDEYLDFVNSYDWTAVMFYKYKKCGIKSATGKVLVPALYDEILYIPHWVNEQSYVAACLQNKWGIVKADGKNTTVTLFEYDNINPIQGNMAVVRKGDKWGYIDVNGLLSTPLHFDYIYDFGEYTFVNGISIFRKDGLYGVTDGVEFSKPVFDEIDVIELDGYVSGIFNSKHGYINKDGEFTEDQEEAYWIASVE